MSFGNLNMLIAIGCLLLFILYSAFKALVQRKMGNSCQQLWYIPVKTTQTNQWLVNQLSCGFNPCLSQTFFQFLDLFEARFLILHCDGTYFGALFGHLSHCLVQLALFASHQYWHVRWAWLHVSHQRARVSHDDFIYLKVCLSLSK